MLNTQPQIPEPPTPRDPRAITRWKATRQRRRLLQGAWSQDLHERLRKAIGHIRKSAWGNPDLSSNVFRSSVQALAVLYDRAPRVTAPAGGEVLVDEVARSGLWSLMRRVQRDCLGMREMLVHVSVVDGDLVFRPVTPDLVIAQAPAARPDIANYLAEAVLRHTDDGPIWTIEEYDLRGPAPVFRVLDRDWKPFVDERFGKEHRGDNYFWRKSGGQPVIPYGWYHASTTGQLFDAYEGQELVEGTLNVGVLWTMFGHVVRNASWPQRYVVGARIVGEHLSADGEEDDGENGGGKRRQVIVDPSVVLELLQDDNAAQVIASQWAASGDPAQLQEAIALYERRVSAAGGINPADVQRVAGDPRSGFAIAISRDAQREACRAYEAQFRKSDEELLSLAAICWNRAMEQSIPETGYAIAYAAIPASPEERQAEREHLLALLDKGLIDRVAVYMALNPGVTEAQAEADLAKIQGINDQTNPAGAAVATEAPLQDTALNPAQVVALLDVIGRVAKKQLPRKSAVSIVRRSFLVSDDDAEAMLGEVGKSFFLEVQEAA